ncbi:MAG: hypothetical protein AB8A40_02940 [Prochlorococcus sp.]
MIAFDPQHDIGCQLKPPVRSSPEALASAGMLPTGKPLMKAC